MGIDFLDYFVLINRYLKSTLNSPKKIVILTRIDFCNFHIRGEENEACRFFSDKLPKYNKCTQN